MKKVAIVSVADQRNISLISLYTELFSRVNIIYDIICIDRYGEKNNYNTCRVYQYSVNQKMDGNKLKKLYYFLQFGEYAKKILRENHYDFVVVWNENTAALLSSYLRIEYKNRYCVNIRDYDYRSRPLIKWRCEEAVRASAFSTVVSPMMINVVNGYSCTLVMSHNKKILKEIPPRNCLRIEFPIRISFIGKIRTFEADRYLMNAFANDSRFILQFIGEDSWKHEDYIKNNCIKNVKLIKEFPPEDTKKYLEITDIIDVHYGENFPNIKWFAPIKFGYAVRLNIPILVTRDTYMEEVGRKYGFAFSIDSRLPNKSLANQIYEWYTGLDFEVLKNGCKAYCDYVDAVNMNFEKVCLQSILGDDENRYGIHKPDEAV